MFDDQVKIDIRLGSARAAMMHDVDRLFDQRKDHVKQLLNKTLDETDLDAFVVSEARRVIADKAKFLAEEVMRAHWPVDKKLAEKAQSIIRKLVLEELSKLVEE